jgi:hypothetical protein
MISRKLPLGCFLLFSPQFSSQYYDAGIWSEISLQSKISKRTEVAVTPEVRLDENVSRVGRAFCDFGVQYKVSSALSLSCIYRSGVAHDYEDTEFRQRIQLGAAFKRKGKKWTLAYLPRWQVSMRGVGEYDADLSTLMRNRFQVKWNLPKKFELSSYAEFFHSTGTFNFANWQSWRANCMLSKNLKGPHSFALGYLIQHQLSSQIPRTDFVIVTSYRIDIELLKEDKAEVVAP